MDSYAQLKKIGLQNQAKAQAEAAQKEAERQRLAKEAAVAQAKREAAERKRSEELRREREERDRRLREEDRKRQLELPKTRNLFALKQERIKRGLDPDGKDDPSASKASSRSSSSSSAKAKAAREAGPLTREEKAAKKRNALFKDSRDWDEPESSGGMALARAMKEAGRPSSSYSSATRAPAPKPLPKPPSANSATIKSSKHLNGSAKLSAPRPASPANGASARDRLKAGFDPTQFVKLNTAKRDLRTIEEIERDMKLKKSGVDPSSVSRTSGSTVASTSTSKSLLPKNGTSHSSSSTMQKRKPGDGRDQTQNSKRPRMDDRTTSSSRSRRDRSSSRSEESEYESSSEDDWDRRRGRKEKSGLGDSMRSEIWKIMGRDRQRDMAMTTYSDDESDMEATGADLWREEQRAERLAKKEDEEEQERLRIRAEEKRKRKALKG